MPPAFLLRFALILLQTRLVGPIKGIAGTRADPETFFLDEPTASVDEANTAIIDNLKKDGRTLVIMTTHDRDQAARLADCLLIMKEGRLEEARERS
jgi:ABC-type multidrug transport system ATPase subunit